MSFLFFTYFHGTSLPSSFHLDHYPFSVFTHPKLLWEEGNPLPPSALTQFTVLECTPSTFLALSFHVVPVLRLLWKFCFKELQIAADAQEHSIFVRMSVGVFGVACSLFMVSQTHTQEQTLHVNSPV